MKTLNTQALRKIVIALAVGLWVPSVIAQNSADSARSATLGSSTSAARPALRGSVIAVRPVTPPPAPLVEKKPEAQASTEIGAEPDKPKAPPTAEIVTKLNSDPVRKSAAPEPLPAVAQAPETAPVQLPRVEPSTPAPTPPGAAAEPAPWPASMPMPGRRAPAPTPPGATAEPAPWPASMPMPGRRAPVAQAAPAQAPIAPVAAPTAAPTIAEAPAPAFKQARPQAAAPSVPQLQTHLPGVGAIQGAKRLAPNTVRVSENTVEEVMVSSAFPNRISTPFANPRVIDSSGSDITKDGGSVYIKPVGGAPVAIFISGDRPGDPVISLLLKPTDVGPQTVVLQLDERQRQSAAIESASEAAQSTPLPYSARLVDVLKQVAVGTVPRGFSGGPVPHSVGRMGDLMLRTESRYSNSDLEVHTYWVTNISPREVALDESMFYTEDVRAIAFYPESQLAPSGSTRILVVAQIQLEDR